MMHSSCPGKLNLLFALFSFLDLSQGSVVALLSSFFEYRFLKASALEKALEPEVIELVHYFKISDRHARMLNEQLKLLGPSTNRDFGHLWSIYSFMKLVRAWDILGVQSQLLPSH